MPRNDDDDDRPRKRRPRDDEDDDRPSNRRKLRREDDDRPTVNRRHLDDDDDRPRRKRRKKKTKVPPVGTAGIVSVALGLFSVFFYFLCCGPIAIVPAGVGLFLGANGYALAQKSKGRQTPIVPAIGFAICLVVTVLSIIFAPAFIRDFQAGYEDAMNRHGH